MPEKDYHKVKEASLHAVDYLQVVRNRWKEIFLTFLLVFMASAVVTYLLPPTYRTTAQFSINPPRAMVNVFRASGMTLQDRLESRNYLTTQFEVISSSETLKFVVRSMNLSREWGGVSEDAAITRLKSMIDVVPRRNTDLVDIYVRGSDPKLVQGIAEGIIEAYRQRREIEEGEYALSAIKKLSETLQMARDDMANKNHQLRTLIASGGYINTGIWNSSSDILPLTVENEEEAHRLAQERLRKLKADEETLKTLIAGIEKIDDSELLNYITSADLLEADVVGASTLREVFKVYQAKTQERDLLLAQGYGPKHYRVEALEGDIKVEWEKLQTGLSGLRGSLDQKLVLLQQQYEEQLKIADQFKRDLQNKTLRDNELIEAKRAYAVALENVREMERTHIVEVSNLRIPRAPLSIHEHAVTPQQPVSPKISMNLAIGAAAGLILGLVVAFMLEYFDTSVKTVEEVEKSLNVPVIGVVPKDIGIFYKQPADTPDVEAYRILRTNIELTKKALNEISIAFVSGTAGEGKTTTLCNLAYVYAQAGYTTLMIDADMRRSRLNQYFDLDNSYGLSNFLTSDDTMEDVVMETGMENLYILPSGPTPRDPSGLLSSRKMAELLREAKSRFDVVLIDSPPILGVSDSAIIVRAVDITVMVVQPRKLSEKVLQKEKDVIENSGGNLIGVVLNNVDIGSDHQYQYYTTYYMYTPSQGGPTKQKRRSSKSGQETVADSGGGKGQLPARDVFDSRSDQEDLY